MDTPPAATDSSPEKLLGEPPEIATLRAMSTDRALWRVANRDLEIGTVIDIGASDGRWSNVCAKHYPDAHYLLIEAQDSHEEALKAYVSAHPKAHYVVAAAGDACGEIYFAKTVPHHPLAARNRINMNMPFYATGS